MSNLIQEGEKKNQEVGLWPFLVFSGFNSTWAMRNLR